MIEVKDKAGQTVYVSYIPDVDPNEGGYYCETFRDEDEDEKIDDFVIHPEDLQDITNEDEVEGYIKNYYLDEILDLDFDF